MGDKICVVGWYFLPEIYKYFCDNFLSNIYIVCHRHNKILDEMNFNYSVIKNIGLEFGTYDWYIKNVWDKKSNVLFIHDDIEIFDKKVINKIFKKCRNKDYVYILGKSRRKTQGKNYRCFYLSKKIINLFLKKFDGIWFDKYNQGYITGFKHAYDPINYTEKYYRSCDGVGKQFKKTLIYLREKYNLKWGRVMINGLGFFRAGKDDGRIDKRLVDNSIFNRKNDNVLERIAIKYNRKRSREYNYYTKWYEFYFNFNRLDNLNILEIGVDNKDGLNIWKKYFKNSDVYGISKFKMNDKNIFYMENFSKDRIDEINNFVSEGFDIIIENGKYYNDKRIKIFEYLFSHMRNWGVYIVEDLNINNEITSFLKNEINVLNCNGKFKTYNIENNIWEKILEKKEKQIGSINFHPGICFIFKRFG